jgi:hypothetical protein
MALFPSLNLYASTNLYPSITNTPTAVLVAPDSNWYIGPLGGLRALPCPEVDLEVNPVRYGGVHQGLSGARVMDVTGWRNDYKLEFKYLDQDEFRWLEAIYMQVVPGPHYLINPLKRNLLSAQSTALYSGQLGITVGGTTANVNDYPSELPFPVRSTKMQDWVGTSNLMIFDNGRPVPIYRTDPLIYSVYLKADAALSVTLQAYWYNISGSLIGNTDTTVAIDTEWSRYWTSYLEPPNGAVGLTAAINFGTAGSDIYVAAPQVESGYTPSAFDLGGGAATVIIDEFPEVSPRYPLRNVAVTLLET